MVVWAAKFNDYDRELDQLWVAWQASEDEDEAENRVAILNREEDRWRVFFYARLLSRYYMGDWRRWVRRPLDFWRHVHSVTLTKWSRLRD